MEAYDQIKMGSAGGVAGSRGHVSLVHPRLKSRLGSTGEDIDAFGPAQEGGGGRRGAC